MPVDDMARERTTMMLKIVNIDKNILVFYCCLSQCSIQHTPASVCFTQTSSAFPLSWCYMSNLAKFESFVIIDQVKIYQRRHSLRCMFFKFIVCFTLKICQCRAVSWYETWCPTALYRKRRTATSVKWNIWFSIGIALFMASLSLTRCNDSMINVWWYLNYIW